MSAVSFVATEGNERKKLKEVQGMKNFAGRTADVVASESIGCRDFNQFSEPARQLVLVTSGDEKNKNPDCFINNLGHTLALSQTIQQAACLIAESKQLPGSYEDYLQVISNEVLRKYHQGTHQHMVQVYWFLCLLHKLIQDQGAAGLTNYGTQERLVIEHLACKMPEQRWRKVELAGIVHDACKAAFSLDFWLSTGKFNQDQSSLLSFHTSLFVPLAEMFAVDPEVTALTVLHHFVIKEYPGHDVVSLFNQLLLDDTFCFMVEAINYADFYSALRAKRPEYRPEGVDSFSHKESLSLINEVVRKKKVGSWVIKCIESLHQSGWLDWLFPAQNPNSVLYAN
ncbi:MAG: hypothetical protein GF365_03260 [Candidatus Buchananbacteria bacterium]|nr:hypothetical protein [Candidatus Buchananbacteria bacterium]